MMAARGGGVVAVLGNGLREWEKNQPEVAVVAAEVVGLQENEKKKRK